jgi:hypothetical protein
MEIRRESLEDIGEITRINNVESKRVRLKDDNFFKRYLDIPLSSKN